jgi:hypothetical protein
LVIERLDGERVHELNNGVAGRQRICVTAKPLAVVEESEVNFSFTESALKSCVQPLAVTPLKLVIRALVAPFNILSWSTMVCVFVDRNNFNLPPAGQLYFTEVQSTLFW